MPKLFFALFLSLVTLFVVACEEKAKSSFIEDNAHLFDNTPVVMKMYKEYNEELLKDFDIDFRVATTTKEEDINLFANKKFQKLKDTSRSQSGKDLLIVINPKTDAVRLEVSKALESVYTDAFVSYIERKGMVPYLREQKFADALYMITELVRDRALEARTGKEFMPAMKSDSIGAGAKSKANIAKKDTHAKEGKNVISIASDMPKDVLQKYIKSLREHNKNPNLDIYTKETQEFFRKWVVTDINQKHEIHNLRPCLAKQKTLLDSSDTHAVLAVLPYDENRKCSPYFFKKEDGAWKLDIATMAQSLRFSKDMQWHFDIQKRLDKEGKYYAYAFDGYGFDKHGYPFFKDLHKSKWSGYRWGYTCAEWYDPRDADKIASEPKKYIRCWISNYAYGMPANVRLGLDVQDYVIAVGEGSERKENVSYVEFMQYMKDAPSGSLVHVEVMRNGKKVVREGIAP